MTVALLALVLGWTASSGRAIAPVSQASPTTTHLQTVQSEYNIMLASYVRPLDPAALLGAAWSGATDYLTQKNAPYHTQEPSFSGDRDRDFASFSSAWSSLAGEAAGVVDFTQVAFAANGAMAASLGDNHTGFLSPDQYEQEQQQDLGAASTTANGLGIESDLTPPHVIREIAPDAPAERAGLRAGDTITTVNGTSVEQQRGAAYHSRFDGTAGTTIDVKVNRPGVGQLDMTVVLGPYYFPVFSAKILTNNVGYMRLTKFVSPWSIREDGKTVLQELDDALASFESAGVAVWVLDLRDNIGGQTLTNQEFAGRFLADGKTDFAGDARGNQAESLVSGNPLPIQRPLAVLVNGGSASSSEVLASTLKEYGRAILVGRRTAGALAEAELYPLPDGAGLQVTVANVVSGRNHTQIDGAGIAVDVQANGPSAADLAANDDPGVDAAVTALAGQPTASAAPSGDATLSVTDLRATLGRYEVAASDVPTAPEINTINYFGDFVINHYNEWNDWEGPASDAEAARDAARRRGWQGALLQFFGQVPEGPGLIVEADLYATAEGATAAVSANDFPDLLTAENPSIQLGDQTAAYSGHWLDLGSRAIQWRHGRVVFTVAFSTVPGEETFAPLVTLANAVDARYQASPLTPSGQ